MILRVPIANIRKAERVNARLRGSVPFRSLGLVLAYQRGKTHTLKVQRTNIPTSGPRTSTGGWPRTLSGQRAKTRTSVPPSPAGYTTPEVRVVTPFRASVNSRAVTRIY